jgi:hypothetical protein
MGPYGFDPMTESFELEAPVDAEELVRARGLVAETLKPAERPLIADELAKLRLRTKSSDPPEFLNAQLNLYADDLAEYPADVVVDALRSWGRRETFWPSAAELIGECDRRVLRRKRLRDALSRG